MKRRVHVLVFVILGVEHAVVVIIIVIIVVEASASMVAPTCTSARSPCLSLGLGRRQRTCSTAHAGCCG